MPLRRFSSTQADRTIATTRVGMAAFSLFAIWLDPAEPARYAALTYSLHAAYVMYSSLIAAVSWSRLRLQWLALTTLVVDLVIFSVFQYLTTGTSSPFFVYFVFVLFCAALRWGWRGTLRAIPVVVGVFLLIGASMSWGLGSTEFQLNYLIIRTGYLLTIGALLVYLGRHEADRRHEIQQLARWPTGAGNNADLVRVCLEYAAKLVGAHAAVLVWSVNDEPRTSVARWSPAAFDVATCLPGEIEPWVAESLGSHAFVCAGPPTGQTVAAVQRGQQIEEWHGVPMHEAIAARLGGGSVGSAGVQTDLVSGRVFFAWAEIPTVDLLPLLEAVARQVGASLDQLTARDQLRRLAIGEERVRLARDLHDGVLQSLTGVRFELQSLARAFSEETLATTRDRMLAMERALALEQRELRLFIEDLKPLTRTASAGSLLHRLETLREHLSAQWRVPVDVRVDQPPGTLLPPALDHAVVPLVQEAVVNALKHGQPSRVRVIVQSSAEGLEVVIVDDGRGFDFQGRMDHDALAARNLGPASLRERVASLGGRLAIESSASSGTRVEMALPFAFSPS
jgi:signal transduction histidine kinase